MSLWRGVGGAEAAALAHELSKELGEGHALSGRKFRVVARRQDCGDVAFDFVPGGLCIVHLRYEGAAEPGGPTFEFVAELPEETTRPS